MHKKTVTAVLPARNCRQDLYKCLKALTAGEYVPEIIVVDDGSKDGTGQMVRKSWPSAVVLTLGAHTGYAHAANAGLRLVRTEYAFLLRPDLQPSRRCVKRLLEAVSGEADQKGGSGIFCAVPHVLAPDRPRPARPDKKTGKNRRTGSLSRPEPTLAAPDGCAMYRMEVLERIGWLDERHYDGLEAFDLSMRAALYGFDTVRVEGACVRPADGNGKDRKLDLKQRQEQEQKQDQRQKQRQEQEAARKMLRGKLAAGNSLFTFYKNMPRLQRILAFPLETAVRRTQEAALLQRGGKEEYRMAIQRGRMLCALEKERRMAFEEGASSWPEKLPDASYLAMGKEAGKIYPLFLAFREPASPDRIPQYLRICRLLFCDLVRSGSRRARS